MTKEISMDDKVMDILLKYREEYIKNFSWPWLDEYPLSMKNANKSLLASILDFQMDADLVWKNAEILTEEVFKDPKNLWNYILEKYPNKEDWDSFLLEQKKKGFSIHRFDWATKKIWEVAKEIVKDYNGDSRNIWKDFNSKEELIENIKKAIVTKSDTIPRMIILALNEKKHIKIKSDVKPDIHVKKVIGRLYFGSEVNEKKALEITRKLSPENPGILDNPLYMIGKNICKKEPECEACRLNQICEYRKNHNNLLQPKVSET